MAAAAALIALWCATAGPQSRPLLIESARLTVPATVRTITIDAAGSWYLSDPVEHTVAWRTPEGLDRSTVGGYGWGLSALDQPSGSATDGNRVYVSDRGNHRIVVYDRALRPLSSFSTRDTSDARARFGYPEAVAVSGRGDMIVLDGESGEVVGFRPDGRVAFRLGRDIPGLPPLKQPSSLRVDATERLLVGETGGILVFDLFGNPLRRTELGSGVAIRGVAGSPEWLAAVSADTLYLASRERQEVHRWPVSMLAPDDGPQELWDVVWQRGALYVLTTGAVLVFRLEE